MNEGHFVCSSSSSVALNERDALPLRVGREIRMCWRAARPRLWLCWLDSERCIVQERELMTRLAAGCIIAVFHVDLLSVAVTPVVVRTA